MSDYAPEMQDPGDGDMFGAFEDAVNAAEAVTMMGARIADCLEEHLHEYGWEPYRYRPSPAYPEGEHKGVDYNRRTHEVALTGADGTTFIVRVALHSGAPGA